jgi:hypothetical protein
MLVNQRDPDLFTYGGDQLRRAVEALEAAQREVHQAQLSASGRHLEEALSGIEDDLGDHLAQLRNAAADDAADAEETGDVDRRRQAWFPRYEAA